MKSEQYKEKPRKIDEIEIYLSQIYSKKKILSKEEERDLIERSRSDNKAKDELLLNTLWVVPAIAKNFLGSYLSFIDLIGEGHFGLINAVNSLDEYKGESKFSTYAGNSVKNMIVTALRKEEVRKKISLDSLLSEDSNDGSLEDKKIETPDKIAEKKEELKNIKRKLRNLTKRLNEQTQVIFKKYYYEDKNMREIAEELNYKSVSSIHHRLKNGLEKLRDFMEAA